MNVLAVRTAVEWCREWCSSGNGPIFLEVNTYRYHGHSMSDPGITYRSREEVSGVRQARDPVQRVKQWLLELGGVGQDRARRRVQPVRHLGRHVQGRAAPGIEEAWRTFARGSASTSGAALSVAWNGFTERCSGVREYAIEVERNGGVLWSLGGVGSGAGRRPRRRGPRGSMRGGRSRRARRGASPRSTSAPSAPPAVARRRGRARRGWGPVAKGRGRFEHIPVIDNKNNNDYHHHHYYHF